MKKLQIFIFLPTSNTRIKSYSRDPKVYRDEEIDPNFQYKIDLRKDDLSVFVMLPIFKEKIVCYFLFSIPE